MSRDFHYSFSATTSSFSGMTSPDEELIVLGRNPLDMVNLYRIGGLLLKKPSPPLIFMFSNKRKYDNKKTKILSMLGWN